VNLMAAGNAGQLQLEMAEEVWDCFSISWRGGEEEKEKEKEKEKGRKFENFEKITVSLDF